MSRRERWKWRLAHLVADRAPRRQCWSDLVDWVVNDSPVRLTGLRYALPWRPIGKSCVADARASGRCYCGTVGADGTVLPRGASVCVTRMPGREADRHGPDALADLRGLLVTRQRDARRVDP